MINIDDEKLDELKKLALEYGRIEVENDGKSENWHDSYVWEEHGYFMAIIDALNIITGSHWDYHKETDSLVEYK